MNISYLLPLNLIITAKCKIFLLKVALKPINDKTVRMCIFTTKIINNVLGILNMYLSKLREMEICTGVAKGGAENAGTSHSMHGHSYHRALGARTPPSRPWHG